MNNRARGAPHQGLEGEAEFESSRPKPARIWDHWLGGTHNYAADRAACARLAAEHPGLVERVCTTRYFLARALCHLVAETGVRQFLDIGSGLPTAGNTHETAHREAPEARVVYVDNDPPTVRHATAVLSLSSLEGVVCLQGDLHEPEAVLAAAARTLDLSRPVALVLSGILGHVPALEEAYGIVRRLMAALPSGSHLVAHDISDTDGDWCDVQARHNATTAFPYLLRTPKEIAGYFDGLDLLEPGVVPVVAWRPAPDDPGLEGRGSGGRTALAPDIVGGIGRKP